MDTARVLVLAPCGSRGPGGHTRGGCADPLPPCPQPLASQPASLGSGQLVLREPILGLVGARLAPGIQTFGDPVANVQGVVRKIQRLSDSYPLILSMGDLVAAVNEEADLAA
jgi:hypothetical protein